MAVAVAIVAEAAVIVVEAAMTVAGEEDQGILHRAVPRALTEGRCPFVMVHPAPVVAASGEADPLMSNLAYICKSYP